MNRYEPLDPTRVISEEEHQRRFWFIWKHLVDRAREAANKHAASWRDFRVGCAAFAWDPKRHALADFGERWKVITAANMKPVEGEQNICCERLAIGTARNAEYERIIGLVVVGEPQPDHRSGLITPTLHPCYHCRTFMLAMPETNREPLTIITAHLEDDGVHELYSLTELVKIHQR